MAGAIKSFGECNYVLNELRFCMRIVTGINIRQRNNGVEHDYRSKVKSVGMDKLGRSWRRAICGGEHGTIKNDDFRDKTSKRVDNLLSGEKNTEQIKLVTDLARELEPKI